jgi:uncharacterized hydrophobic protein (TIGR00271 family)
VHEDTDKDSLIKSILEGAKPSASYFILLLLSTLIAAFGLIIGSTATVIGAMILAPLMGPIMGLALSSLRGESQAFYRALSAEWAGVVLCVLTGAAVAWIVGPENIDFTSREITGRLRPTLFDLAIGVFAGLAGAYCASNLSRGGGGAGAAGVAIAVALVPPLTVTGLCLSGAIKGQVPWQFVLTSFLLFMANFLTIEMASTLVFWIEGLGTGKNLLKGGFRNHTVVLFILLLLTGGFLYQELDRLLREREYHVLAEKEINKHLSFIPGSTLDVLELTLFQGKLKINAVVSVDRDITRATVAKIERAIDGHVPADVDSELVIRLVKSSLLGSRGLIHQKTAEGPGGEGQQEIIEASLHQLIDELGQVNLENYRIVEEQSSSITLEVVLRGSQERLTPNYVRLLERGLMYLMKKNGSRYQGVKLLVKQILVEPTVSSQPVQAQEKPQVEKDQLIEYESTITEALRKLLDEGEHKRYHGSYVTEMLRYRSKDLATPLRVLLVRSLFDKPSSVSAADIRGWEKNLTENLAPRYENLVIVMTVGEANEDNPPSLLVTQYQDDLERELRSLAGVKLGEVEGDIRLALLKPGNMEEPGVLDLEFKLSTPELLERETIDRWEDVLTRMARTFDVGYQIRLKIHNRAGFFYVPGGPPYSSSSGIEDSVTGKEGTKPDKRPKVEKPEEES